MKGYQVLENDFFPLCRTREIPAIPMLLYIYLRGLYSRFRKSDIYVYDKEVRKDLPISQSTLARAREFLQTRGLITYQSGKGSKATTYTMLGTVLLPTVKKTARPRNIKPTGCRQNNDTYNRAVNQELKNRVGEEVYSGIFKGTTEAEKASVRAILLPRNQSVDSLSETKRKG